LSTHIRSAYIIYTKTLMLVEMLHCFIEMENVAMVETASK